MGLREFFKSSGGKVVAVLLLIASGVAVWYSVRNSFGDDPAMAMSTDPIFVDSENHSWHQKISAGDPAPPFKSPVTGKMDGYPAELCYWTKDGKKRAVPFPVYLKEAAGQPGPTFCPDCGRLVTQHNRTYEERDGVPPPTEAEFKSK